MAAIPIPIPPVRAPAPLIVVWRPKAGCLQVLTTRKGVIHTPDAAQTSHLPSRATIAWLPVPAAETARSLRAAMNGPHFVPTHFGVRLEGDAFLRVALPQIEPHGSHNIMRWISSASHSVSLPPATGAGWSVEQLDVDPAVKWAWGAFCGLGGLAGKNRRALEEYIPAEFSAAQQAARREAEHTARMAAFDAVVGGGAGAGAGREAAEVTAKVTAEVTAHMARLAAEGAIRRNDMCVVTLVPLSELDELLVPPCGHVCGNTVSTLTTCPTCRAPATWTHVKRSDLEV